MVFAVTMLWLNKPAQLITWATLGFNFALGFSAWHTLAINHLLLPRPLRPGLLPTLGLLLGGLFFWLLGIVAVLDQLQKIGWLTLMSVEQALGRPAPRLIPVVRCLLKLAPRLQYNATLEDAQMSLRTYSHALLIIFFAVANYSRAQDPIDFRPAPPFLQLPPNTKLGPCSGVDIDSRGNIYLIQRQSPPILCLRLRRANSSAPGAHR